MSEKYGFIYLWFDRKHKRFYLGRRWGKTTDKYICSSNWMKQAYNRRPNDFKRRILSYVYSSKEALVVEEQRWLDLIKDNELGKRYYNYSKNAKTPHHGVTHSEETKKKIRESNRGVKRSDSTREANRQASLKQFSNEEQRQKIAEASKKMWEDPEYREKQRQKKIGRKQTAEQIQKRINTTKERGKNRGPKLNSNGPWNKGMKFHYEIVDGLKQRIYE